MTSTEHFDRTKPPFELGERVMLKAGKQRGRVVYAKAPRIPGHEWLVTVEFDETEDYMEWVQEYRASSLESIPT